MLALAGLLACRPTTNPQATDQAKSRIPDPVAFDLDQIRERGELIALLDNSSTSYFLYKGRPMGYEYDLLTLLADELGVKLRLEITSDLEEAFIKLNNGEGDIIAHNLTVTKERKQWIAFTQAHHLVRQVLVQRKPEDWRHMKMHEIDRAMIRNPIELIGKEVTVRKSSSYASRLQNLSDEIGGDIVIVEAPNEMDTESLIRQVAEGKIPYTVADEDIARVNKTYYPILDVETEVSFPQQIAWGVRKNAPELQSYINTWLTFMKRKPDFYVIYNKYFKNEKAQLRRVRSDFYSAQEPGKFSPYDDLIKSAVDSLLPGWDWRLVAAQVYQESKFDPQAESWMGAQGLMQLVPETGEYYGANNLFDPTENIWAGVKHLAWLENIFEPKVADAEERKKFILASYNVGQGHVLDARRLARKNGADPESWADVEKFLTLKSKPQYFNDPAVTNGYCRCTEPVRYVNEIYTRFERYQQLMPDQILSDSLMATASL